jgi:hypothetical protein
MSVRGQFRKSSSHRRPCLAHRRAALRALGAVQRPSSQDSAEFTSAPGALERFRQLTSGFEGSHGLLCCHRNGGFCVRDAPPCCCNRRYGQRDFVVRTVNDHQPIIVPERQVIREKLAAGFFHDLGNSGLAILGLEIIPLSASELYLPRRT